MISPQDCIWVCPETAAEELGTFEQPVSDIGRAVGTARPGQHIVLKPGVYRGDVTIQQSGLQDMPLHIRPDSPGSVHIDGACWYFYDTSDLLVTGLHFRGAPAGAISVIGACRRNAFTDLVFDGCSRGKQPACTMFFGGSGGRDNAVERCVFREATPDSESELDAEKASVALMITQGDSDGGEANRDYSILENSFLNYGFGVLVGTRDDTAGLYGHLVECNTFDGCRGDGVVVKCGDTTIRANRFSRIGRSAIALIAGHASIVESNRMVDCGLGCAVSGPGHTLAGNCIVRAASGAIRVRRVDGILPTDSATVLIEHNTLIDCATDTPGTAAVITADPGTSSVLDRNLFSGTAAPWRLDDAAGSQPSMFCIDNISSGHAGELRGCAMAAIDFPGRAGDTFINNSGYGAGGWPLTTESPRREESEYYSPAELSNRTEDSGKTEAEQLFDEADRGHLLAQGLFFDEGKEKTG